MICSGKERYFYRHDDEDVGTFEFDAEDDVEIRFSLQWKNM